MPSAFSPLRAAAAMLALSPLAPAAARACAVVVLREPSIAEKQRTARESIERATAIVDGEVVRPFVRGLQPAVVRAFRILKGPQQAFFEVGERHSCDRAFVQVGERARLILVGGPDLYFAPDTGAEHRYVDRLLRSDRRRDWPYRAGTDSRAE